jgi:glycosyltransferase involved in cell wall biosynthesis
MRVLIASTYIPFIRGGGTQIIDDLCAELQARGFDADAVFLPFYPHWKSFPEQAVALRLLDVCGSSNRPIDRLITVRTPAHVLRHPNKVVWFLHHYREAYDLWGTYWTGMPNDHTGRYYRNLIMRTDNLHLRQARAVYTISQNVAGRLKRFNEIEANAVLYPPLPRAHPFRPGSFDDYFFYPSRITPIKRQLLAIEALKYTDPNVRLVVAGAVEDTVYGRQIQEFIQLEGLSERVRLTGWISESAKAEWMANCCCVLFVPYDEDYGYVTVEAFQSQKPVITCTDSGGSLELVDHSFNGLVVDPDPRALADAMNGLWRDRGRAQELGLAGPNALRTHRIDWDYVIEKLTA